MWRNFLTLVLAFAVALVGVNPHLNAQEQYPVDQGDSGPAYGQPYPDDGEDPGSSQQGQSGAADAIDIPGSEQHGVARLSVVQGD
ncbi:MAG: hypothetical protein JWP08_1595, partial [Bryobacterales bacterium]|nr:hypothetical protein [Bryobacterales bacterium]